MLLVDCNNLCYRALHTTGDLMYQKKPVGVIFGFLNQLGTLINITRPDTIVFIWDSQSSIRKQKYPFYKFKQPITDPQMAKTFHDAYEQFDLIRTELLAEMGFMNSILQYGYEADDIIARVCQDVHHESRPIVIASTDTDLYQLLQRDRVQIFNVANRKLFTERLFVNEYKIPPRDWVQVKQIAGCSSDAVPGIPGVGIKTAVKYLRGELKALSEKYRTICSPEGLAIRKRNRWLVELPIEGTQPVSLSEPTPFKPAGLTNICKRFGFNQWLTNAPRIEDWDAILNRTRGML